MNNERRAALPVRVSSSAGLGGCHTFFLPQPREPDLATTRMLRDGSNLQPTAAMPRQGRRRSANKRVRRVLEQLECHRHARALALQGWQGETTAAIDDVRELFIRAA